MDDVVKKTMGAWRSKEFDKFLAIATLENEVDFLNEVSIYIFEIQFKCNEIFVYNDGLAGLQVNTHSSNNPKPEMSLEKLQKIVTTPIHGKYKKKMVVVGFHSNVT